MSKVMRRQNKAEANPEIILNKPIVTAKGSYPKRWAVTNLNDMTRILSYHIITGDGGLLCFTRRECESKQMGKLTITLEGKPAYLYDLFYEHSLPIDQQPKIRNIVSADSIDAILDYDGTGDNLYLPVMTRGLVFLLFPSEAGMDNRVVHFRINGKKYHTRMVYAFDDNARPLDQFEAGFILNHLEEFSPKLERNLTSFADADPRLLEILASRIPDRE